MKRTAILSRGAPIKRTAMKRTSARSTARPSTDNKLAKVWKKKTRGPRMTPIRKSARGEDCMMGIPGVCNRDPATTVLCHSNQLADGKGLGLKAPDTKACYGCSACHDVLDGRAPMPAWMTRDQLLAIFTAAMVLTHSILKKKGLMK